jgi:hypothetical protein
MKIRMCFGEHFKHKRVDFYVIQNISNKNCLWDHSCVSLHILKRLFHKNVIHHADITSLIKIRY